MGKDAPNPTIRILMLGAAGVGKNCLESRFTTMTYPPPYNPALTLNSRRYFTLPPIHAAGDCEEEPGQTTDKKDVVVTTEERPQTSSTGTPPPDPETASLDDRTLIASSIGSSLCSACARENNTYLVEIINYADLQSATVRKQVHAKADYDAVLLVYDVTSSASFNAISTLHAEIPVCTRKNHHAHHRRAVPHTNTTRSRTSGWFGGGGNETGTTGSGEIVVGLVGNGCDVDDDEDGAEVPDTTEAGASGPSGANLTEDDLLHPLYRESILYEELTASREAKEKKTKTAPGVKTEAPPTAETKNDDIQKWLQISRPEPALPLPEVVSEVVVPPSPLKKSPPAGAHRTRQVTPSDGAALALALQLPVPFLETSAKSGHHVERALENLVREVLREMGRDASGSNKAGKTCRHRVGKPSKGKEKGKEKMLHHFESLASPKSPVVHQVLASPPPPPSVHDIAVQRPESAAMFRDAKNWTDGEGGHEIGVAVSPGPPISPISPVQPVSPVSPVHPVSPTQAPTVQRRESVMGRMRKVFWRKSQQEQHTANIAV
ncbi:hypothetical protein SEUCBS140593_007867 [Sporothrix eucalyptigena]|uniref:small monomeric GTPase n=1 Tax=Sporothrix eucalyptigena TaxID=1812306 RepID=A0ABP0CH37_9PEZI